MLTTATAVPMLRPRGGGSTARSLCRHLGACRPVGFESPRIIVLVPSARRSGHYRRTAGSAKIAVLMPEGIRVGDRGVGRVGPLLPVGRPDSSSAGAEQHDRNVALGPGLVLVVFGPLRRHGRPHALLVFGRPGARPDREDLVPHLDLHVGVRDQVLVPSGVLRRARHQTVGTVPPSITYSLPWIEAARSDARKATSSATSSGRPGLPIGIPPSESIRLSRAVSASVPALSARRTMRPWAAAVSMKPGATVFTRMPLGPTSFDSPLL